MAYTLRKKRHCVKQALLGLTPVSEICRNRRIPRRTLYRWIHRYKKYGALGLNNKIPGAKKLKLIRIVKLLFVIFGININMDHIKLGLNLKPKVLAFLNAKFKKYSTKMDLK